MTAFRFDAGAHAYYINGRRVPSITQMLKAEGWIDDRFYTEESSERGREAHRLTADYDLGALDVATCRSGYRGYLLSHVDAMARLQPTVLAVEEARYSELGFGGRPDRVVAVDGQLGVLEGKSGQRDESHRLQTALQAILVAPAYGLPAESLGRWCVYWKLSVRRGGAWRWVIDTHADPTDFIEARRIVRACCGS